MIAKKSNGSSVFVEIGGVLILEIGILLRVSLVFRFASTTATTGLFQAERLYSFHL